MISSAAKRIINTAEIAKLDATKIEVVSFVILLMNLTVPIFNRIFRPVIFGAPSIKEKLKARAAKKEAK